MSLNSLFSKYLVLILILFAIVTGSSLIVPEVAFDSLWYHLTIPKLYIMHGGIYNIPGGLLYYSQMPRLLELFYVPLLMISNIYSIHLLNFLFGMATAVLVYKIARIYVDRFHSILASTIFYVTPIVGWISSSAYIDLGRAFFETSAFYFLLKKGYILLAVSLGLAIGTKTLSLGSLGIYGIILLYQRVSVINLIKIGILIFVLASPWFISAYVNTGYPFYPIGSGLLDETHVIKLSVSNFFFDYWRLFVNPIDAITPIYVAFLPFLILTLKKFKTPNEKILLLFFALSYVVWFVIPRTGGGRFILPYLSVWAVLVCVVFSKITEKSYKFILALAILATITINFASRLVVVTKNLNYLRTHSQSQYLCANLPFEMGTFYDCDGFFAKTITGSDLVLLSNVHNLYYVNFPFVHESWWKNEKVNYVASIGQPSAKVYEMIKDKPLIYSNSTTKINLWKL